MEKLIDALQLPKDLMLGALNIIKLLGKNSKAMITGERLKIVCFSKDDMRIKGYLQEIKFYWVYINGGIYVWKAL